MRIKDLQSGAGLVSAEFDKMLFVVDMALPDSTLKINGADLRRGMGVGPHQHEMGEVEGLADALHKKLDKTGGVVSGSLEVRDNVKASGVDVQVMTAKNAEVVDANIINIIFEALRSKGYMDGEQGRGFDLSTNADGVCTLTVDNIRVLKEAVFKLLTIEETRAVGAKQILSYARAKVTKVVDGGEAYRCYYESGGAGQYWQVGAQALCEIFNADKTTQKYYWRLVVKVGSELIDGESVQWVELSKSNALGAGVPAAGDELVGLGFQGDDATLRQAIILDAWGVNGPQINVYDNISSFVMPEPIITLGKDTVISAENIRLIAKDGTTTQIARERGAWDKFKVPYYNFDRVSFEGRIYLCITSSADGVINPPSPNDHLDWLVEVDRGLDGEQGIPGMNGINGQTSYFHIKYSPVENPTASQISEIPNTYIGTYVDFVEADSTDPSKYKWSRFEGLQGSKGEQGIPGVNGEDGKTTYLHIKYSDNGTTFTANNGEIPGAWIGQYTDYTINDSMTFDQYKWTKIKGEDGELDVGKILFRDAEFREGLNGCGVYNNLFDGAVVITRIERPSDCPTTSTHCLQVTTNAAANPGHGGYHQSVNSRPNGVFMSRIIAKIPVGSTLCIAHNPYGNEGTTKALTPMYGTGKYEVYMWKVICGSTGNNFGTINHYYLNGGAIPVTWYVASSTVYDMNEVETGPSAEKIVTDINKTPDGITVSAEKIELISRMLKFGKFAVDDNGNATMVGLRAIDAIIDNTMARNVMKCGVMTVNNTAAATFVDQAVNYRYLADTKGGQLYTNFGIEKPPNVAVSETRIDVTYALELPYKADVYFMLDMVVPKGWSVKVIPYVAKSNGAHMREPIVYGALTHTDTSQARRYCLRGFPATYVENGQKLSTCIGFQYTFSTPASAGALSYSFAPKFKTDYSEFPQINSSRAMYKSSNEVIVDDRGTRVQYGGAAIVVKDNYIILDCFNQYSGEMEMRIGDVSLVINRTRLLKLKQLLG